MVFRVHFLNTVNVGNTALYLSYKKGDEKLIEVRSLLASHESTSTSCISWRNLSELSWRRIVWSLEVVFGQSVEVLQFEDEK